ncbi:hypothetical protein AOZ06_38045 [Kibdelosporangium phytohabitans]|uniref:Cytochrome n=1 Tax=Kibdelosporangium phytohabitans TaxID=860235 RepID=A0A0N9IIU6_9PSEU|nr:hypothetical protein AOZ06_38045 [Kibdelosporangium phytohabitans]
MPPVPDGGPPVGIRWLRRNVARFTDGPDHERRRAQVTTILAAIDVADLRQQAAEHTRAILAGRPAVLVADVAGVVPAAVLGHALGAPDLPVGAVAAVAGAYQPGTGPEEPADEAVAELVELMGGTADEPTAGRIALLAQAYAATAGLVGNAVLRRTEGKNPAEVVAETLRDDPPVRATRRAEPGTGTVVSVDLAGSGLPFGAGPHECPGQVHAIAIAEGILEAVRAS